MVPACEGSVGAKVIVYTLLPVEVNVIQEGRAEPSESSTLTAGKDPVSAHSLPSSKHLPTAGIEDVLLVSAVGGGTVGV